MSLFCDIFLFLLYLFISKISAAKLIIVRTNPAFVQNVSNSLVGVVVIKPIIPKASAQLTKTKMSFMLLLLFLFAMNSIITHTIVNKKEPNGRVNTINSLISCCIVCFFVVITIYIIIIIYYLSSYFHHHCVHHHC